VTVVLPRPTDEIRGDARSADAVPKGKLPDPEIERRERLRHRVMVFVVSVVFVGGLLALLIGERGYVDVRRSRAELRMLQHEVDTQLDVVRNLREEVRALQEDPTALERIAREELGLGRKGEVQILLPRESGTLGSGPEDGTGEGGAGETSP
jgi:cell division protein FtsB